MWPTFCHLHMLVMILLIDVITISRDMMVMIVGMNTAMRHDVAGCCEKSRNVKKRKVPSLTPVSSTALRGIMAASFVG